jgi:hypothetical protein
MAARLVEFRGGSDSASPTETPELVIEQDSLSVAVESRTA